MIEAPLDMPAHGGLCVHDAGSAAELVDFIHPLNAAGWKARLAFPLLVGCNAGFGNCDGTPGNGCETGLSTLSNCGACNTACTQAPLNSTPVCVAMACSFKCTTGWGNCDSNAANGCETLLLSDGANCGNCGAKCSGVLVCSNGMCKLPG